MFALLAVAGGTVVAVALLQTSVWLHDRWRSRQERRTRRPPFAVSATGCADESGAPLSLERIESHLAAARLAGELSFPAYEAGMEWLASREERYGATDSSLPPSFRAEA